MNVRFEIDSKVDRLPNVSVGGTPMEGVVNVEWIVRNGIPLAIVTIRPRDIYYRMDTTVPTSGPLPSQTVTDETDNTSSLDDTWNHHNCSCRGQIV